MADQLDPRLHRIEDAGEDAPELIPAATVILLRDGADGLETLMLRRSSKLDFAGGMWVFPGGRIDPDDHDPADPDGIVGDARRAAVREAAEEAGLAVASDELVWFAHWTPPPVTLKRFATWFFAGPAPIGSVVIDDGEIKDHGWLRPSDALMRRDALEIELAPPTWITLHQLAGYATAAEALTDLGARPPEYFATRFAVQDTAVIAMYDGDAGYEDADPDRPGGRHRLWMLPEGWRYERHP